jgi:hypothetical protein
MKKSRVIFFVIIIVVGSLSYFILNNTFNKNIPSRWNIPFSAIPTSWVKVILNRKENLFLAKKCFLDVSENKPTQYSLKIILEDKDFNKIEFSIQDHKNRKRNLLKEGLHTATGGTLDYFSYFSKDSSYNYTINRLNSDDMEIFLTEVLEKPSLFNNNLYGEYSMIGRIYIKRIIGNNIENQFIEPQEIYFKCEKN